MSRSPFLLYFERGPQRQFDHFSRIAEAASPSRMLWTPRTASTTSKIHKSNTVDRRRTESRSPRSSRGRRRCSYSFLDRKKIPSYAEQWLPDFAKFSKGSDASHHVALPPIFRPRLLKELQTELKRECVDTVCLSPCPLEVIMHKHAFFRQPCIVNVMKPHEEWNVVRWSKSAGTRCKSSAIL